MPRSLQIIAALVLAVSLSTGAGAFFQPGPSFTEIAHTFPLVSGAFIGGMDTGPLVDGTPVVAFSAFGNLHLLHNGSVTPLWTSPSPVYSSFVIADQARTRYIYAEASTFNVMAIGFDGLGQRVLGAVTGAYDAVVAQDGKIFLTRGGFGSPAEVVYFDETSGAVRTIAAFPGASGALAIGASGDLYYATASATFGELGGQTIYRITPGQADAVIGGAPELIPEDLEAVVSGIDTASDLVALPDGRLLFADSIVSPGRIMQISGGSVSAYAVLENPSHYLWHLAEYQGTVYSDIGGIFEGPNYIPVGVIAQLVPEPSGLIALFAGAALVIRRGKTA